MITRDQIDLHKGIDADGYTYSFVHGTNEGGYFFTHYDNITQVVHSVRADALFGPGGLDEVEVQNALFTMLPQMLSKYHEMNCFCQDCRIPVSLTESLHRQKKARQ